MKIGLFAINYGTCADPELAVRVARHAEAAGFESVWTGLCYFRSPTLARQSGTPQSRWTASCTTLTRQPRRSSSPDVLH